MKYFVGILDITLLGCASNHPDLGMPSCAPNAPALRGSQTIGEPITSSELWAFSESCEASHPTLHLVRLRPDSRSADSLPYPLLGPGEFLAVGSCSVNRVRDPEIVAIVNYERKPVLTTIRQAWRASRVMGRSENIRLTGITCHNGWVR